MYFSKNHTKNVVEKLVSDPFLKIEVSLKFYTVCFYCIFKWKTSKKEGGDQLLLPHKVF